MGVKDLHSFIADIAKRGRGNDGEPIQHAFLSMTEAIRHCQPRFIILDILGHLAYFQRRLARELVCYDVLKHLAAQQFKNSFDSLDLAAAEIERRFNTKLHETIQELQAAAPSSKIIAVLDRSGVYTQAKKDTYSARRAERLVQQESFDKAITKLVQIRDRTGPDAIAVDNEQSLRHKRKSKPRRRNHAGEIKFWVDRAKAAASSKVHMRSSLDSAECDGLFAQVWGDSAHIEAAPVGATSWQAANLPIFQSPLPTIVKSLNEADITILNVIHEINPTDTTIVISNDSDYFMSCSNNTRVRVLGFKGFANRRTGNKTKEPWLSTDLQRLFTCREWKWKTLQSRMMAAMIASQDYSPKGVIGLALVLTSKLDLLACLDEQNGNVHESIDDRCARWVSLAKSSMLSKAIPPRSRHAILAHEFTATEAQMLEGLRVVFDRTHTRVGADTVWAAAQTLKDNKAIRTAYPPSGTELEFYLPLRSRPPRPLHRPPASSKRISARPARQFHPSSTHKRHNALDFAAAGTETRLTRENFLKADEEPDYKRWLKGRLPQGSVEQPQPHAQQEAAGGASGEVVAGNVGLEEDSSLDEGREEAWQAIPIADNSANMETQDAESGGRSTIAGDIYSVRSHERILRATIRREPGVPQKDCVISDFFGIITCYQRLAWSTTIDAAWKHYITIITTNPAFAYIARRTFRSALAMKSALRSIIRNLTLFRKSPIGVVRSAKEATVAEQLRLQIDEREGAESKKRIMEGIMLELASIDTSVILKVDSAPSDIAVLIAVSNTFQEGTWPMLPDLPSLVVYSLSTTFAVATIGRVAGLQDSLLRYCCKGLEPFLQDGTTDTVARAVYAWLLSTKQSVDYIRSDIMVVIRANVKDDGAVDSGIQNHNLNNAVDFVLDLLRRRRELIPDDGMSKSLDSYVFSRGETCVPSDAIPFFGSVGHQFTVEMKPQFVNFDSETLYPYVNHARQFMAAIVQWLSTEWLIQLHHTILERPRVLRQSSSALGLLDELRCWQGQRFSSVLLPGSPTDLTLREQWINDLELALHPLLSIPVPINSAKVTSAFVANKLRVMDRLFLPTLPAGDLGYTLFKTDGFRFQIFSVDLKTACLTTAQRKKVQELDPEKPLSSYSIVDLFSACVHLFQPSFCTPHQIETTVPSFCSRDRFRRLHPLQRIAGRLGYDRTAKLVTRHPSQETKDGYPKDLRRLHAGSAKSVEGELETLWGKIKRSHAGARVENDRTMLDCITIVGNDTGIRFPEAIVGNDPLNDRSESFLLSPHGLQEIIRESNVFKARLAEEWPLDQAQLRALDDSTHHTRTKAFSTMLESSATPYSKDSYFRRVKRRKLEDCLLLQFKQSFLKPLRQEGTPRPIIFAIGDGCDIGKSSVKRHTADFALPVFRRVRDRLMREGFPVTFVSVDEAYTSQLCPKPSCKRPPCRTQNWEEIVGLTGPDDPVRKGWIRSRMFKPKFKGTERKCERLLECEQCRRVYNRDSAAGINISFAAYHILRYGRHPWR